MLSFGPWDTHSGPALRQELKPPRLAIVSVFGPPNQPVSCAYRKSSPSILVMQSTQDRTVQNASRCLGGT
jgi:hypothetical protein